MGCDYIPRSSSRLISSKETSVPVWVVTHGAIRVAHQLVLKRDIRTGMGCDSIFNAGWSAISSKETSVPVRTIPQHQALSRRVGARGARSLWKSYAL